MNIKIDNFFFQKEIYKLFLCIEYVVLQICSHMLSSVNRTFKVLKGKHLGRGGVSDSSLNWDYLLHCNKVINCQKKK